jgi:hypothetical protein
MVSRLKKPADRTVRLTHLIMPLLAANVIQITARGSAGIRRQAGEVVNRAICMDLPERRLYCPGLARTNQI